MVRNNHPTYRYGSATAIPRLSPTVTFPIFFTFLPGCYAGEVVRCFHHHAG
ncbi:transcriptional regulator [Escherichia coli O25b:H4]|nr:transcriptional regulator [Escherichia coli O25b:H4]